MSVARPGGKTMWKLALLLYPFAAGAVAINLYMIALMGQSVGLPVLSPVSALIASVFLGVPATWAAARWVCRMIDQAEAGR